MSWSSYQKTKNHRTSAFLISLFVHAVAIATLGTYQLKKESKGEVTIVEINGSAGGGDQENTQAPAPEKAQNAAVSDDESTPASPVPAPAPKVVAEPELPQKNIKATPKLKSTPVVTHMPEKDAAPETSELPAPKPMKTITMNSDDHEAVQVSESKGEDASPLTDDPSASTPVAATAAAEDMLPPVHEQAPVPVPTSAAVPPQVEEPKKTEKPIEKPAAVAVTHKTEEVAPIPSPTPPVNTVGTPSDETAASVGTAEEKTVDQGATKSSNATAMNGATTTNAGVAETPGTGMEPAADQAGHEAGLPEGVVNGDKLKVLKQVRPSYPIADNLKRYEGDTTLLYSVKPDGRVENIRVHKSSGSQTMDQSAAQALRQFVYAPGQDVEALKTFQFRLKGDVRTIPARLGGNKGRQ